VAEVGPTSGVCIAWGCFLLGRKKLTSDGFPEVLVQGHCEAFDIEMTQTSNKGKQIQKNPTRFPF
jgi:hypothetical protein